MNPMKILAAVCFTVAAAGGNALGASYPLKIAVSPGTKAAAVYELPPPEDRSGSYDTVLINGEMPDPGVKLQIGGRDPVASEVFPGGRFWAKYKVSREEPLRLTVLGGAAAGEHVVIIYNAETFMDGGRNEPASSSAVRQTAPGSQKDVPFPVIRRAEWGAVPVSGYTWHTPRKFTLHHTAGPRPADRAAAEAEMRFIQSQHRNGNGWLDIGYHFVVSPQGDIFEGRPVNVQGAHAANHNTDNVGISVMGNYMNDPATPEVLDAVVRLGRYLKDDFGIGEGAFFAHRQLYATACPGDNLYARMHELKDRIFRGPAASVLARGISADPSFGEVAAGGAAVFEQLLKGAAGN